MEKRALFSMTGIFASLVISAGLSRADAQNYTPPPPPLTTAPCVPTKRAPCPALAATPAPVAGDSPFDFPGEGAAKTLPPLETIDDPAHPSQMPAATSHAKKSPPANADDKFAFPGDAPGHASGLPAASSSSPPSSSSTSAGATDDEPTTPSSTAATDSRRPVGSSERRKLPKTEDLVAREAEDLEIAHYYMTTGALAGSYARAKDALRLQPDDPEAHYAVAVAAHGLKKLDEAKQEFAAYLRLDPEGDHVRAARKVLAGLH